MAAFNLATAVQIINAIRAAADTLHKGSGGALPIDRAIKALVAEFTPELPTKPDGSAFTADEVHQAAAAARVDWREVLELTK